jgi:YVTN family beta-propeller protein
MERVDLTTHLGQIVAAWQRQALWIALVAQATSALLSVAAVDALPASKLAQEINSNHLPVTTPSCSGPAACDLDSSIIGAHAQPTYDSPSALAVAEDGRSLFVACASAKQVAVFDTVLARVICRIDVPEPPLGLTLSKNGSRLYVACASPSSTVCIIDAAQLKITGQVSAGHTAMSPVLSPDEKTLYVCNRFSDDISIIDVAKHHEVRRVRVPREPVAAAITPDGKYLIVANHLHAGPSDHLHAQAVVSVIDTAAGRIAKDVYLTHGATLLRGVAVSPDGRFAAVTLVQARFWLPTTDVELGRMNCNALAIVDLNRLRTLGILLLDQTARGAANPWAVGWTPDGKTIIVSHAGTHEVSLVDAPVDANPSSFFSLTLGAYAVGSREPIREPSRHPVRVRKRLPLVGSGPRALAVAGSQLYVANYFSDNLCRIDLAAPEPSPESFPLGPALEPDAVRKGEMFFNDARLCTQGWQSCSSCHDADGRTDAFNWDLLNDGVTNPKNTKSLLGAHQTPPAMSLGVRASAEVAVRAGLHHILFAEQDEEVAAAIDSYLKSLQPVPSPHLVDGCLSAAAERGQRLFMSSRTGCANCHPPPLFTDLNAHDIGTARQFSGLLDTPAADKPSDRFDTPSLAELWRTGPYLHDGSAPTLREVLLERNPDDLHGRTSDLTPAETDELVAYLSSL